MSINCSFNKSAISTDGNYTETLISNEFDGCTTEENGFDDGVTRLLKFKDHALTQFDLNTLSERRKGTILAHREVHNRSMSERKDRLKAIHTKVKAEIERKASLGMNN